MTLAVCTKSASLKEFKNQLILNIFHGKNMGLKDLVDQMGLKDT